MHDAHLTHVRVKSSELWVLISQIEAKPRNPIDGAISKQGAADLDLKGKAYSMRFFSGP